VGAPPLAPATPSQRATGPPALDHGTRKREARAVLASEGARSRGGAGAHPPREGGGEDATEHPRARPRRAAVGDDLDLAAASPPLHVRQPWGFSVFDAEWTEACGTDVYWEAGGLIDMKVWFDANGDAVREIDTFPPTR